MPLGPRATRLLDKNLLQRHLFLQTRTAIFTLKFSYHPHLTKRQWSWIKLMQQTRLSPIPAHPHTRCLATGRKRGYNKFFRTSRMTTNHNLIKHTIPRVLPHTK